MHRIPHDLRVASLPHAVALAAAALFSQAAGAQSAPAPASPASAPAKAETPQTSVIEIVGTRRSIESAIARKRTASTVSDSIVAVDIDQFPDKNVGEALSRITGVQLSREFGEGSRVSIRGVEPDLNRVEINGVSILSTNGSGGRGAELRELASELISSIDVIKGSTADLTEGGIGGTVRINTRRPLDFTKRTVATTLSAESSTSRGGVQPRFSLLLADKFMDGKLGLMANIVYDDVRTRNDYARNTSWTFLRDWDFSSQKTLTSLDPASAAVTAPAGCAALGTAAQRTDCNRQWFDYAPRISRYGIWTRDHQRSSGEFTGQYRFNSELTGWASYEANIQNQKLNDRNFGTDLTAISRLAAAGVGPTYNESTGVPSHAGTCVDVPAASTPAGMTVENHHVTTYTVGNCINVAGQGGQAAFTTSARDFSLKIDSKYLSSGFNYKSGPWQAEGLLADSRSFYQSQSNNIVLTQNAHGLVVKLDSQSVPHFTFPAGYDPESNSSYVAAQLQYRPSTTKNTERQGKLDFKYALDRSIFEQLWFGVQGRESTSAQYNGGGYLASNGANLASTADDINVLGANVNQTFTYDPLYTGAAQRAPDTQTFIASTSANKYISGPQMAQLIAAIRDRSPGTFFKGYGGVSGLPSSWMAPSYDKAAGFFDTSAFNYGNLYNAPGSDGKSYPQIPAFDISEKVSAGYLRMDFRVPLLGQEIDGNFGVRYTHTDVTSSGLFSSRTRVENSPGSATFTDRVLFNSVTAVHNVYSDVLPSFNASTALLGDKLVARVGWSKVMARPAINLLAPNVTCTLNSGKAQFGGDGVDDCTAGNPDLQPYRANKADFSLEYYPSRNTQYSVALFQNNIRTYVLPNARQPNVDFFKDGNLFDVTQPINGRGAVTKGVELAVRQALTALPGWASGLGVDLNYTRMSFRYANGNELLNVLDGSVLPYPGMSKNSWNAALWYDDGTINARLAYHFRDRYYSGANDVTGNPNFNDRTGYLDAKIQYRINDRLSVALEGKNLTNQAELTYSGDPYRLNELAFAGRRYFASVSFKL
ncbi:MAG: TonB-dependent receptor [Burkholderiales bacterium]|nr:TonB-dependent receptor [Burkholderiales bacterium]